MSNEIMVKGFTGPLVKLGSLKDGALICCAGDSGHVAYIKIDHAWVVDLSNGKKMPLNGVEDVVLLNLVELTQEINHG